MMADEKEIRRSLIEQFGAACWGCMDKLSERQLVLDHIIPQVEGGSDEIYNRALLCSPCNSKKGDRLTLSNLRKENNVKTHPVDLKGALPWTREHFLKSFTKQLELLPTETQTNSQSEPTLPDYGSNSVPGLQELRQLLYIRGCEEIAKALQSVVSFKAFSSYNGWDTYIEIEMTVGDIQDYNFLRQGVGEEEKQRLWEAVCEIEGVTIRDSGFEATLRPYVAGRLDNDQGSRSSDDLDELPF